MWCVLFFGPVLTESRRCPECVADVQPARNVDTKMTCSHDIWTTSTLLLIVLVGVSSAASNNLTCYQCVKNVNEECSKENLLPCPPISDRCVTHITKDAKNGFSIKRECGLGPCGFDDAMMNKGLGLDGCDRSKDEYFCVFCCRDSACNKSKAVIVFPSVLAMLFCVLSVGFRVAVF